MTQDAVATALARLDRAVTRIDDALARRSTNNVRAAEAYAELDERHTKLRARIQETIERLDAMIEGAG